MSTHKPKHPADGDPAPDDFQHAEHSHVEGGDALGENEAIDTLKASLEESQGKLLRLLADFQNYQRRALANEQVAKSEGAAKVVMGVVGVVDHFDLALAQNPSKATVEQIIAGVKVIREELLKVLSSNGVVVIRPAPNDLFEPGRHEAVMQQPMDGIEPGHVAAVFQPGYGLATSAGERVLRAAKVSVAPA